MDLCKVDVGTQKVFKLKWRKCSKGILEDRGDLFLVYNNWRKRVNNRLKRNKMHALLLGKEIGLNA